MGSKPDRDELARERATLLAAPPPPPASMLAPPELPTCICPHCTTRAEAEQSTRLAFASWAGRVKTIEILLFKLTWGDETERDELGSDLAELAHDLLGAMDTNRARDWERRVDLDARGREVRAWSTAEVLGEIQGTLVQLHRGIDAMVYLGSAELRKAMAETRAAMFAALATPLKKPLPVDVAQRAGLTGPAPTEADKVGLVPSQGSDPSILGGTIRFSRKSRA
ncbi:MAG: hypothetical protein WEG40_06365 [Candidatus Rokuibacteriota bacterium]